MLEKIYSQLEKCKMQKNSNNYEKKLKIQKNHCQFEKDKNNFKKILSQVKHVMTIGKKKKQKCRKKYLITRKEQNAARVQKIKT